jgi:hypothetical protein
MNAYPENLVGVNIKVMMGDRAPNPFGAADNFSQGLIASSICMSIDKTRFLSNIAPFSFYAFPELIGFGWTVS